MIAAPHHVITVAEYHRMVDAGAFAPGERLELLDGELIAMSPMGNRHYLVVNELAQQFAVAARVAGLKIGIQSPVIISTESEPEPDLVLRRRTPGVPTAADITLIVEVSDSTLAYDRDIKLPRYARAGIPEAWIVDLANDHIDIHTQPGDQGYAHHRRVPFGGALIISGTGVAVEWEWMG